MTRLRQRALNFESDSDDRNWSASGSLDILVSLFKFSEYYTLL